MTFALDVLLPQRNPAVVDSAVGDAGVAGERARERARFHDERHIGTRHNRGNRTEREYCAPRTNSTQCTCTGVISRAGERSLRRGGGPANTEPPELPILVDKPPLRATHSH